MKFQTKEEVKAAAEKSDEAALLCSIEHYNQMLAASEKELREAVLKGETDVDVRYCALCSQHLYGANNCPMGKNCYGTCFDEWGNLQTALYGDSWPEVRAAMGEVRRVLQEKYDELYGGKKKEELKFEKFERCSCHLKVEVDRAATIKLGWGDGSYV